MEWLLTLAVGILMGYCAGRTHPSVDPGFLLSVATGAMGGLIGAALFGPVFARWLFDTPLAGATAAAAIAGVAAVVVTGIATHHMRQRALPPPRDPR